MNSDQIKIKVSEELKESLPSLLSNDFIGEVFDHIGPEAFLDLFQANNINEAYAKCIEHLSNLDNWEFKFGEYLSLKANFNISPLEKRLKYIIIQANYTDSNKTLFKIFLNRQ